MLPSPPKLSTCVLTVLGGKGREEEGNPVFPGGEEITPRMSGVIIQNAKTFGGIFQSEIVVVKF